MLPLIPQIEPVTATPRPFWSVMIPSYNSANLLERTLETVLEQDPGSSAMQIEVVDDASTEGGIAEVVARVGRGRVALFVQPHNVGPSANFTTCVRRSLGHWVHILHSDDLVAPGFYECYRDRILACPDAVMVAGQTIDIDAEERPVWVTRPVTVEDGYVRDAAFTIVADNPVRFVAAVVARRTYERVGGFRPELFHTSDWEMWARVAASGPVAWVGEPYGRYRVHPDSDTSRLHKSTAYLDDCLRAVRMMSRHVEPVRRRQALRAGRRHVAMYATSVSNDLAGQCQYRLAALNAARALAIDPSVRTCSQLLYMTRKWVSDDRGSGRYLE
jgi:glycosyltransferase involved in cell wall biosynthesis